MAGHDQTPSEEDVPRRSAQLNEHQDACVSLRGVEGEEVAKNLGRLAAHLIESTQLSDAYFIAPDGALGLVVDDETYELLSS
jgi:hypothetical protein